MQSIRTEIEDWREKVEGREVNASTVDDYARWVGRFEAWRSGDDDAEGLMRKFDSFLQDDGRTDYPWVNSRGRAPPDEYAYRSRVKALSAVKLWMKHHHNEEVSTEVQNICLGEPADFDPTIVDEREVMQTIRNARTDCDNESCHVAIRVGYNAIMRGAEVCDIRYEDVNFDDRTLYVRAVKGSDTSHIELSDTAWRTLRDWARNHSDRDKLFRNSYGNPWKPDSFNQHFRRKHHPAGSHAVFRHSAVTNRLKSGEDFNDVYLRARHQNPQTTLQYVNLIGGEAPDWVGD